MDCVRAMISVSCDRLNAAEVCPRDLKSSILNDLQILDAIALCASDDPDVASRAKALSSALNQVMKLMDDVHPAE